MEGPFHPRDLDRNCVRAIFPCGARKQIGSGSGAFAVWWGNKGPLIIVVVAKSPIVDLDAALAAAPFRRGTKVLDC